MYKQGKLGRTKIEIQNKVSGKNQKNILDLLG